MLANKPKNIKTSSWLKSNEKICTEMNTFEIIYRIAELLEQIVSNG